MRLVKIELRDPNPFWNLHPIYLSKDKKESPMINIDALSDKQQEVINHSINAKFVRLIDLDGNLLEGNLSDINVFDGNTVSTEDINEEKDALPEIVSVTIPIEEEEDEEGQGEEEITEEVYENAKILLTKNGNTVKKTLRNLPNNTENLLFFHACLELEMNGHNREGIVLAIQSKITE